MERRPGVCETSQDRTWKDNPVWYGICYEDDNALQGFWGELRDPYEQAPQNPLLSGPHQNPSHFTDEHLYQLLVKRTLDSIFFSTCCQQNEGPIKDVP